MITANKQTISHVNEAKVTGFRSSGPGSGTLSGDGWKFAPQPGQNRTESGHWARQLLQVTRLDPWPAQ